MAMRGLPAARRSASGSMPWSMALRSMCVSGSASMSDVPLSMRMPPVSATKRTCLSRLRADSRTMRGKRPASVSSGMTRRPSVLSWIRLMMRPISTSTEQKSRCCRSSLSTSARSSGARVTAISDSRRSASGTSDSTASTLSRLAMEKNSPMRPNSLSSTSTGTRTWVSSAASERPATFAETANSPSAPPGSSRLISPTTVQPASRSFPASASGSS